LFSFQDDYVVALAKARKAEDTSDLGTEGSESEKKSRKARKHIDDSSGGDDSPVKKKKRSLPLPPAPKFPSLADKGPGVKRSLDRDSCSNLLQNNKKLSSSETRNILLQSASQKSTTVRSVLCLPKNVNSMQSSTSTGITNDRSVRNASTIMVTPKRVTNSGKTDNRYQVSSGRCESSCNGTGRGTEESAKSSEDKSEMFIFLKGL
jgi:hypothetical protein